MKIVIRNTLAVIAGMLIGGMVNMGLITVSGHVIAPPAGADVTTMEGLLASIHLFEAKHFLFPFLAHAMGTLVGAVIVARFAATQQLRLAMLVGVISLAGGVSAVMMIPAPLWFDTVDLVFAYIPMAWLGYQLGRR